MIFYLFYFLTILAKTLNIAFYFFLSLFHKIVDYRHMLNHDFLMFFHDFFNIINVIISLHSFLKIGNPLFNPVFNLLFPSFIFFIGHLTEIILFLGIRPNADALTTETKIFKSLQCQFIIFFFMKGDDGVSLFDHHPLQRSRVFLQKVIYDDRTVILDGNLDHIINNYY